MRGRRNDDLFQKGGKSMVKKRVIKDADIKEAKDGVQHWAVNFDDGTTKDLNIKVSPKIPVPKKDGERKQGLTPESIAKTVVLGTVFTEFQTEGTQDANDERLKQALIKALDALGYVVEFPDHFFASPVATGIVSPVFSLGLQKEIKPVNIKDGFQTTLIYLSRKKPQSKAEIQLRLFDNIPEERMRELERGFKGALTPYGLKCLYLVIEECSKNNRKPYFVLDTNRCLDLLGHTRNKKAVHHPKNRKNLLREINDLTQINFNTERTESKKGKPKKDRVIRFNAPLLSITGQFEEWEVDSGRPAEEGVKIKDNLQIFLHPQIYDDIGNYYTLTPRSFLAIDARSRPYAILLYPYIANQWRIGWHQYQGTIKQPMHQILDGAGLMSRLPKRNNKQIEFVGKIKDTLRWLKNQKAFWIKSVRFESGFKPMFDEVVTIVMADDHPLRVAMKNKRIEK